MRKLESVCRFVLVYVVLPVTFMQSVSWFCFIVLAVGLAEKKNISDTAWRKLEHDFGLDLEFETPLWAPASCSPK